MKQGPSFRPAVCLGVFLELDHQISLVFGMVLETLMCVTRSYFLEKLFLSQKLVKWAKKFFFNLKKKFAFNFH